MIGDGADQVLCLEPNLMHVSQFACINHFVGSKKIRMIPERLENSGISDTNFDLIFSMGLLYHQRNPEQHLIGLKSLLEIQGKMILETIICPDKFGMAIEPSEGRYASMPNVHFVHSDLGCKEIFEKLGLEVVAETKPVHTNPEEQRKTKWMPFKSFESSENGSFIFGSNFIKRSTKSSLFPETGKLLSFNLCLSSETLSDIKSSAIKCGENSLLSNHPKEYSKRLDFVPCPSF